jgi:two-component sensor histidine kinase
MANKLSEHGNSVRVTRWIERLPLASGNPLVGLVFTTAIFAVAWTLRVVADPVLPSGFPYVTFFPAVIITSFLFGVRMGFLSAVMCGFVAWYYFIPPVNSFKLKGAGVPLAFYIFVVTTELLLVLGMQTANRQLVREREVNRELVEAKDHIVQELEQQIAERKQAIDDLHESEVKTQLAIQTAGIGLWQWHIASGKILWDPTMFELYGIPPTPDGSVQYIDYISSVHPDDVVQQDAILQETVSQCSASTREFRIHRRDDGTVRYIRAVETGRAGPDGNTEWVVGTNLDITEQKNRDSHVQLLMGEVNHRAKNLLAVVMSVAHHTSGADHAEFMRKFSDRVQSLAAGQDLLVEKEWKGVELDTLVRAQLSHFKDLIGVRIIIGGAQVHLSPPSVQTIGMAIHELTTNASKYGALSDDNGRITIAWQIVSILDAEHLVMAWTETDGPKVIPPQRSGFGSTVTEKMVKFGLNGEVLREFAPSGFCWRLQCPLENVVERKA